MIPSFETIDWHRFLARPALPAPSPETISSLIQQPILITGAGGSIGSALGLRLASHGGRVILLESSENNLYDLQREFADLALSPRAAFYLGSVAEPFLLDELFRSTARASSSMQRPTSTFPSSKTSPWPPLPTTFSPPKT